MTTNGTQLPPSHNAGNGYDSTTVSDKHVTADAGSEGTNRSSKGKNLLLASLLAIAVALAAAPASGYKSGWAYYRRSNYLAPPVYRVPVPFKLQIWVGWIKGTNSLTNVLHRLAPQRFNEYTYLHEVRESGQVVAGLAIAFLLVSGLVGFIYFLFCLLNAIRGGKSRAVSTPPGLGIAGIVFGLLNMAWSIACYIVIAVGTTIYTRERLQATYVPWPDWCFFLAFFSGVFFLIAGIMSWAGRSKARRASGGMYGDKMTHNMAYDNHPAGTMYEGKPSAVV